MVQKSCFHKPRVQLIFPCTINLDRLHISWHMACSHTSLWSYWKFSALFYNIFWTSRIDWASSVFHHNLLNHYCRSIWKISKLSPSLLKESADTRSGKIIPMRGSVVSVWNYFPTPTFGFPLGFLLMHLRITFSFLRRQHIFEYAF